MGISDLAAWHAVHQAKGSRYAKDLEAACGGAPGDSPEVDREYRARSPLTYLAAAKDLPLDIAAGIHDGHTGSVPVSHALWAFNALAKANDEPAFSDQEIEQWCQPNEAASEGLPQDDVWRRAVHLRKRSGHVRVTLFEGGHEGLPLAALEFLGQHQRDQPIEFTERALAPTLPDENAEAKQ